MFSVGDLVVLKKSRGFTDQRTYAVTRVVFDMGMQFVALLEREAANKIEDIVSKGINQAEIHEILKNLEEQKSVYCKNTKDEDVFSLSRRGISMIKIYVNYRRK